MSTQGCNQDCTQLLLTPGGIMPMGGGICRHRQQQHNTTPPSIDGLSELPNFTAKVRLKAQLLPWQALASVMQST